MNAHNAGAVLHDAQPQIVDPGNGKTITVNESLSTCNLASAAAETRTLGRPTKQGVIHTDYMKTDGGDITLTVTGGYNEAGNTTIVFSDVGQFAEFRSFMTAAGVYFWRLVGHHGLGNIPANDATAEIVTTTNVITAQESGKTFYLDNATGFVSTLPAVALGLKYTFIMKTAVTVTAGHTIVCPGAAALFKGTVLTCDLNSATDSDFGITGEATITFVIAKAIASDRVDVECDGTNWHFVASCTVFDAIIVA